MEGSENSTFFSESKNLLIPPCRDYQSVSASDSTSCDAAPKKGIAHTKSKLFEGLDELILDNGPSQLKPLKCHALTKRALHEVQEPAATMLKGPRGCDGKKRHEMALPTDCTEVKATWFKDTSNFHQPHQGVTKMLQNSKRKTASKL